MISKLFNISRQICRFFVLLILFLTHLLSTASEPDTLIIKRTSGPIELDGLSNEEAWKQIEPLPVIMQVPDFGIEPTEKTEILVTYNDNYLYVAGRLFDSEPDKIQYPSMKRDEMNVNNDWFGLILDTFNDNENAMAFFTTPSGLRMDLSVFNDAVGGFPLNVTWNTFWDVKTVRNDEGWFVEMRIPLSSLRYQAINDQIVMGLIAWRWIARKSEAIIYPAIPYKWGWWSRFKPSQAGNVVFMNLQEKHPLYIAPYVLGGYEWSYELNDEETEYIYEEKPKYQAGLDVKYGLTSNLTLDVTINPDFAQVEADNLQVNLTRFSLFFPEKRLFFQERSSNFEFKFGGPNQLFYSRRIGLYEEDIVPIYGGVRLVGRTGKWDIGFLDMQTAPVDKYDLPSENFGVVRLRRQVINQNTYVGGMVTSRLGTDGSYNIAYGLDGIFYLGGNDYLLFNWAQTFEDSATNNPTSLDPTRVQLKWERRTNEGFGIDLSLSRSGIDYNPAMGFELREDYVRFSNRVWYGWLPDTDSKLLTHQIYLRGLIFQRNSDWKSETIVVESGWEFETKSSYTGLISFNYNYESVQDTFSLSDDVYIPVGNYEFFSSQLIFSTPYSAMTNAFFACNAGQFYDGKRLTLSVTPTWSVSSNLVLSGFYEFNYVDFQERNQKFLAHIARIHTLIMLNTKVSFSAFVQYNSLDNLTVANFRFRYNPREGNDLYLVYNEDFNANRNNQEPVSPFSNTRTILLKFTYTFRLKG